jgi:hypothetical protein
MLAFVEEWGRKRKGQRLSTLKRPEGDEAQQAAGDGNVLPEHQVHRHLHLGRDRPVGMAQEAGGDGEDGQDEGHESGLEAEHEEQRDAQLHQDGDHGGDFGHRHAKVGEVAHGAGKAGELAPAGRQEQRGDHEAADEGQAALGRGDG